MKHYLVSTAGKEEYLPLKDGENLEEKVAAIIDKAGGNEAEVKVLDVVGMIKAEVKRTVVMNIEAN